MAMRSLEELVAVDDPALPILESWIASASNGMEVFPAERAAGERTLLALQVTARSILGAIALQTGGVLVDGGWLRILGAGGDRLPRDVATWNGLPKGEHRLPGAVLVADDAVGGFFAKDCGKGFSDWLHWTCIGDLAGFYESMRWPGWQDEVASLDTSQAISVYPFLFAEGEPIAQRSRRPIPIEEMWSLHAIELPR